MPPPLPSCQRLQVCGTSWMEAPRLALLPLALCLHCLQGQGCWSLNPAGLQCPHVPITGACHLRGAGCRWRLRPCRCGALHTPLALSIALVWHRRRLTLPALVLRCVTARDLQTAREGTPEPLRLSTWTLPVSALRQTARLGDPSTPLPATPVANQRARWSCCPAASNSQGWGFKDSKRPAGPLFPGNFGWRHYHFLKVQEAIQSDCLGGSSKKTQMYVVTRGPFATVEPSRSHRKLGHLPGGGSRLKRVDRWHSSFTFQPSARASDLLPSVLPNQNRHDPLSRPAAVVLEMWMLSPVQSPAPAAWPPESQRRSAVVLRCRSELLALQPVPVRTPGPSAMPRLSHAGWLNASC